MKVSIIIPTYNEAENIGPLVRFLLTHGKSSLVDIIVSDGGSNDATIERATEAGAAVVSSPAKGRALQMNYGASQAKGEVLYFIHADCFPPATFMKDLQQAIGDGYDMGRYRTKFDSGKTILKINEWFTRFDLFMCMGGDQTFFIKHSLFDQCRGFREDLEIMEEFEFCSRARKSGTYKILNGAALISARKYKHNSWLRVQLANARIMRMYKRDASSREMVATYQHLLSQNAY